MAGEEMSDRSLVPVPDRQLALLVESVVDYAIFMLDPQGYVLTWNRGAERIKGYSAEEIIGRHFSTFYSEDAKASDHPAEELVIALRDGRFEEEGWRIRKDGSEFWASVVITAIHDPEGNHIGFGKVTRDLTARRLAEEELRGTARELEKANRELRQFHLMVASVRDYAIFIIDPGGYVATWNAGAERFKGYTPEEIIGQHFSVFYTEEDREANRPAELLGIAAREGRVEEEGWRVRKDGTRFWANVVITALRDERGVLVGYAKVTRDLTERREAQRELEMFSSSAAHDMQEPLRTISGFAELLARRYGDDLPEEALEYLGHMANASDRMQRLITDLLAYARSGAATTPREPVPLTEALANVVDGLAGTLRDRDTQLVTGVPEDAVVCGDRFGIELVLQNLIGNAVKFAAREAPRVEVAAERAGESWLLTVADNGPGIPADAQERIFDPFVQLTVGEERGTGLGLSICRRVVDRHGGSIGVDSRPGEGSRFWVRLPALADAA
jgi:PAS domain S-box-containing protein